jgi:hypothetical protein
MYNQYYLELMIKERSREIELAVKQNNLIAQHKKSKPKKINLLCLALGNMFMYIGEYLRKTGTQSLPCLNETSEQDCFRGCNLKTLNNGNS